MLDAAEAGEFPIVDVDAGWELQAPRATVQAMQQRMLFVMKAPTVPRVQHLSGSVVSFGGTDARYSPQGAVSAG